MNDLNCPNCGTTYPSLEPGLCGCCDYEFTPEFINKFVSAENEKEQQRLRKIEEENRQRQLLIEKAERERREKAEAERLKRLEAEKKRLREQQERERLKALEEKINKQYQKDMGFSKGFRRFGTALSTFGVVLVILSLVSTVLFSYELDVSYIAPVHVIEEKADNVWSHKMFPVKYDVENGMLEKTWKSEESFDSPQWVITLFNSISSVSGNQSTIQEKLNFMFPNITGFVDSFVENSENTHTDESVESSSEEDSSEINDEVTEIIDQSY